MLKQTWLLENCWSTKFVFEIAKLWFTCKLWLWIVCCMFLSYYKSWSWVTVAQNSVSCCESHTIHRVAFHSLMLYLFCRTEKFNFTICKFWNLEKCILTYMLTWLLQSVWIKDLSFYLIHQSDVFYCVIVCGEIIDTWLALPAPVFVGST